MAEENIDQAKRATKEDLLRLITDVIDVEIEGKIFGIRPITYVEDAEFERVADDERTEDEKMRKRILLTVWKGLMNPRMEILEIEQLPVTLVTKIAIEIGNVSSGVSKN